MSRLHPLIFHPIFKERVWGGDRIGALFGKDVPRGTPTGESWEICDRPGDQSVVAAGPLAGRSLGSLMEERGEELSGSRERRFPLLVKILDARKRLSLQVHPPADRARALGGEPKTELWYMADCDPGAELHVGLRAGVGRDLFEERLRQGRVAECFHRIPVRSGDAMFLPSGRVHAIGEGNVIFEIQENSDTTYRVFDWNRMGLDGRPRELHVGQSLRSIDFSDHEPALVDSPWEEGRGGTRRRVLADHPAFRAEQVELRGGRRLDPAPRARVVGTISGRARLEGGGVAVDLAPGRFALLPAGMAAVLESGGALRILLAQAG